MAVHPSKPSDRRTLWDALRELLAFEMVNGGQVSIINRLDRETSGLTLVAKSRASARTLCRQMERRTIAKEYLALVWGWPASDAWTIDAPLLRQGDVRESQIYLKQTVDPRGSPALTHFRVEWRFATSSHERSRFSLVRAIPVTGRMHQIRVHLSHAGFPIVGDKIYGPDEACYLEFIESGWTPELESRLLLPRHALHSASLQLQESGCGWSSPLPMDLLEFTSNSRLDREFARDREKAHPITPP